MAIQERRGNYADFDPSKLVAGEPFICLDKVNGEYYAGIAVAPNQFMRLGDYNEILDVRTDCEQYAQDAEASKDAAAISEQNAATSESNAATSETNAATYWGYVHDAIDLVVPTVTVNFVTGQLEVAGSSWWFGINQTTGNLEYAVSHA